MNTETAKLLQAIREHYDLPGTLVRFAPFVNGHINETYRVTFQLSTGDFQEYVFQRINDYVFKEPSKVMHNIREVGRHVQNKKKQGDCDILTFLENKAGENYVIYEDGFWRISPYVANSVSFDVAEDPQVLESAGYAFGRFQYLLSDLPMDRLYDTIPDFHNTKKRLNDFFMMVAFDPHDRVKEVREEVRFFEQHRDIAIRLVEMQEKGELPLRVTHNDTKYNNILMDKDTLHPLCVIDLDTVMPGLSAHDYGDAIRFAANTGVEDESDLSKVGLDMVNFEAFTKGFVTASKELLTKSELDTMALGAIVITIELASRFLADHINGDKYFRIHRENHNLERARCQIKLAQDMLAKYDEMCAIVQKYAG